MKRPPFIKTEPSDSQPGSTLKRDTSLLPGEVPTPSSVARLSDWMRAPGSTVWDEASDEEDDRGDEPHSALVTQTKDDNWVSEVSSPLIGDAEQDDAQQQQQQPKARRSHFDEPSTPFTTNPSRAGGAVPPSSFTVQQQQQPSYTAVDEPSNARDIIASAALPSGMASLGEYIRAGQPQVAYTDADSGNRNYPYPVQQLDSSPPPPQQAQRGRGGQHTYTNHPYSRGGGGGTSAMFGGGEQPLPPQQQQPFTVNSGGALPPAQRPTYLLANPSAGDSLNELLFFHANFFPPPPPPPPATQEGRRQRALRWYHYASKWDVTQRLPPPPRNPIPEMERELREGVPRMTYTPYYGDGWLEMSERWFAVVQTLFDYPMENTGTEVDANVVLDEAVVD